MPSFHATKVLAESHNQKSEFQSYSEKAELAIVECDKTQFSRLLLVSREGHIITDSINFSDISDIRVLTDEDPSSGFIRGVIIIKAEEGKKEKLAFVDAFTSKDGVDSQCYTDFLTRQMEETWGLSLQVQDKRLYEVIADAFSDAAGKIKGFPYGSVAIISVLSAGLLYGFSRAINWLKKKKAIRKEERLKLLEEERKRLAERKRGIDEAKRKKAEERENMKKREAEARKMKEEEDAKKKEMEKKNEEQFGKDRDYYEAKLCEFEAKYENAKTEDEVYHLSAEEGAIIDELNRKYPDDKMFYSLKNLIDDTRYWRNEAMTRVTGDEHWVNTRY